MRAAAEEEGKRPEGVGGRLSPLALPLLAALFRWARPNACAEMKINPECCPIAV